MKPNIIECLEQNPLLPLFYHEDLGLLQDILGACHAAGITAFEYTNRGEAALPTFTALMEYKNQHYPTMALGIGTIYNVNQAIAYKHAHADFIVQPFIDEEVGHFCVENDLPWVPGTMTFGEIHKAETIGAQVVKLFPGNIMGPDFLKAMKGPMPNTKVLVTGGVEPTEASIKTWRGVGAFGLGLGSQLFNADVVKNKNMAALEQTLKLCFTWV